MRLDGWTVACLASVRSGDETVGRSAGRDDRMVTGAWMTEFVGTFLAEFFLVSWVYFRFNRQSNSGLITFASVLAFAQMFQKLGNLPLKWH